VVALLTPAMVNARGLARTDGVAFNPGERVVFERTAP
jgi:hypothetical protein